MKKIMIVEDDKTIAEELLFLLNNSDYEGIILKDFENSKKEILAANPDLILLDINIPCMHNGSYDDEPATVELMHNYMEEKGYELDITDKRYHHEIYLSDPRKCDVSKLKTVIRHPIKKK